MKVDDLVIVKPGQSKKQVLRIARWYATGPVWVVKDLLESGSDQLHYEQELTLLKVKPRHTCRSTVRTLEDKPFNIRRVYYDSPTGKFSYYGYDPYSHAFSTQTEEQLIADCRNRIE